MEKITPSWKTLLQNDKPGVKLEQFYTGIDRVPAVIDKNLILDCFYITCNKEFRKKKKKEDIDYGEIHYLYLDSQDILKIDHLWMLENLKVLSLAHNNIEKIENLESLSNLTELNLSFNKITDIEGLGELNKLEILSLYNNKIRELKDLSLQNLKIFSLGNNLIEDRECISLLSNFKNLLSLNMENNPCTQTDMFKESLAAFLPSLVYYNYEFISDYERKIGMEINKEALKALDDLDKKKQAYLKKLKEYKERTHFLKNSYIDGLEGDDLFYKMFEVDSDGIVFKNESDRFSDVYERLRMITTEVCSKIFDAGGDNYKRRKDEVEVFRHNSLENTDLAAKRLAQATARVSSRLNALLLRARSYFKGSMTKQLKKDAKSLKLWLQGLKVLKEFADKYLDEQWFYLMRIEMKTCEQNEETINLYDRNLADIMNVFIEEAQSQFTRLRDAENDCLEEMSNRLYKFMNDIHHNNSLDSLPPKLRAIMQDRESLNNAIAASHDCHTLVIDTKEDSIISRLREWHRRETGDLMNREMLRNRKVVLDINRYIDNLKKEFEEQMCGVLNLFKFLEPNENFEQDLDEIIKHWLERKKPISEILRLEEPKTDDDKDKGILGSDIFSTD